MKRFSLRPRRRFALRSLALASLMWLGTGIQASPGPFHPTEAEAAAASGKRTAAYVYDSAGLTLRDSDAPHLDQLNYSFALIKNGEVSGSHWQSIDVFRRYVEKHSHILPVLAIGGWGADGFSQAASTADGRARFVDSTLVLMERHGFLGVDIDWEYPGSSAAGIASSANDRTNFTVLLQALREGLDRLTAQDGKPRMLAVALGGDPWHIRNLDVKAIGALCDQVNLMTYDLQAEGVASHHTPLYGASESYLQSVDLAVRSYVEAGLPRSKIMIGAAFYGRSFTLKQNTAQPVWTQAAGTGKSLTYDRLKTVLADAQTGFDEQAKAPYATDGTTFWTYDDPVSIHYKGAYALENGLMGMMCWEYGGDSSGELLAAMHDSLSGNLTARP